MCAYDLIAKAIKNTYGVTNGYSFTAISDVGRKYLDKRWSIQDEIVNPIATEFYLKDMEEHGVKVDLRYE